MMRLLIALVLIAVPTALVAQQEGRIVLDSPDQARSGTGVYDVQTLVIERGDLSQPAPRGAYIQVTLTGENGLSKTVAWRDSDGEDASSLIAALNTANLSTRSLQQRILDRAVADGKIGTGTVQ